MVADVAQTFFAGIWKMMLQTDYPGLGVSVAGVVISAFLIRFSISLFGLISGVSGGASDYGRAADFIERHKAAKPAKASKSH